MGDTARGWLHRLAGLAGLAMLGIALALAVRHLTDMWRAQHLTGVWLGLAQAWLDGNAYPPLHDNGYYGGTRYMPVLVALIAGLSRLTGDLLIGAKLSALITTGALVAGVMTESRQRSGSQGVGR